MLILLSILSSACIRRYQSLNLNHVREHSMPIYEFRWRTHTQVLSQGGDSSYCPVVKWVKRDGNDGEPFSAKTGADLFSSLRGSKHVVRHSSGGLKERRHAERRVERKTKIRDRWTVLTVTVELMFASDLIFYFVLSFFLVYFYFNFVLPDFFALSQDLSRLQNRSFLQWRH